MIAFERQRPKLARSLALSKRLKVYATKPKKLNSLDRAIKQIENAQSYRFASFKEHQKHILD
ncbi:hypothetical protein BKH43_07410 [Helicobacter sp. 13S00401-1]|uniref:hypothetical protein n=1 Tax=Helicobacter sp. 13S00401-1 TaxID=1905758 RepID=UPI000BA791D5|nr:hypothetical protein [Helicobacter sp. 13S00401-1]PAF49012.1 hypothetical protein BKH43_07410 [Helicobacter sp. 13S00401-1]